MKQILVGISIILFSIFLMSCTPANVDFSGSQLNNLKYSFSSNDPVNNTITLYSNQTSTINFKTSDKTLDSLNIKIKYEILSAEAFNIAQAFSNYTENITIPAGANSFAISFQTNTSFPFSGSSADLKMTISSIDNTINFSPEEIRIKLINQASSLPAITFNTLPYINILNQASYLLSGTCSDITNFLLVIDTFEFSISCSGGTWSKFADLSILVDGSYSVYAKNLTKTATYQSSAVTKDTLAPTINSINDSVTHGSTTNSPNISWVNSDTGSGVSKVEIALGSLTTTQDKFSWFDIGLVSNYQMTGLSLSNASSYYVQLRSTDNAGNISLNYNGDGFLVDTTLPTAILSSTPPANTKIASYYVDVSGTSVAEYSFKYGSFATTDCSSASGYSSFIGTAAKISISTVSEDKYKLCVVAKNGLGNTQAFSSATQHIWTYDTTNPVLSITNPASGSYVNSVNKSSFNITSSCSENGKNVNFYAESLVDSSNVNSSSSCSGNQATIALDLSSLPDGGLKIKSYQTDDASNTGYSAYVTYNKDIIAPILSGGITVVNYYNSSSSTPSISWSVATDSGSGLFNYKIALGTTSYSDNVHSWTSLATNDPTVINGLALSDGQTYYVSVYAVDNAGNQSSVLTNSWTVDQTMPAISLIAPLDNAFITEANQSNLNVQVNCENGLNTVFTVTSQADSNFKETRSPLCTGGNLSEAFNVITYPQGSIQITVSQTDQAGNTKSISVTNIKDTQIPVFGVTTVSDGDYYNSTSQSPNITWSGATDTNGILKYQIALGSAYGMNDIIGWTDIGNVTSKQLTGGLILSDEITYYPSVRAVDLAGNISSPINGNGWTVDVTPPSSPTTITDDNQWGDSTTSPTIRWVASSDSLSGINYYKVRIIDSTLSEIAAWTSAGNSTTYSFAGLTLTSGNTYFTEVKAVDNAGNESAVGTSDGWLQVDPGWKAESFIKAVNADSVDSFGSSVAIDGDTLVVGVPNEASNQTTITNGNTASSDNSIASAGAVYVYKRTWNQAAYKYEWSQEAYIKATNAEAADNFGYTVSIYADTLAVGAIYESSNQTIITNGSTASANNSASFAGAVYVYKRTGTSWSQEAYIKASNANASDSFGMSLYLKNDLLFVGATYEASNQTTITNGTTSSSDNSLNSSGAVYVYKRSGTLWSQEAYIKASNAGASDFFGSSLAFDIDTLVVGATGESSNQTTITNGTTSSSDNSLNSSGAVYVYKRSSTVWSQEAYIKASNADASDFFGNSVSISGNTLVVGAYREASNQNFITNGMTSSSNNSFGYSGAAYVYTRSGTTWSQEAYIKPSNSTGVNYFGFNVSISGSVIAIGAHGEDSNQTTITNGNSASSDVSLSNSGAVYVFTKNAGNWEQTAYIKAPNASASDSFGNHISLMNNTLSVSATGEDSSHTNIQNSSSGFTYDEGKSNSGAVYIFKFD